MRIALKKLKKSTKSTEFLKKMPLKKKVLKRGCLIRSKSRFGTKMAWFFNHPASHFHLFWKQHPGSPFLFYCYCYTWLLLLYMHDDAVCLSFSQPLSLSLSNRPISTYCLHLRDFAICHSVRISFPSPLHLLPCFYTTTSGLIYELFGTRKFEFSVSFSNYCDFGTLIADEWPTATL